MPRIHLGVYLTSGKETENAVKYALEVSRPFCEVRRIEPTICRLVIEGKSQYPNGR